MMTSPPQVQQFDEEDVILLQLVASQAAVMVAHARANEESSRRLEKARYNGQLVSYA